ncbi:hypothetical protein SAMD00019534_066540 [Acytostelium subglobosum LB1]|uniref:hypothetical protein n=1 Tax=Acytostelium subglobosum LB1 TaxID=1410327 RepID=UPI00064493C3|nr:hypothetical protein SAMD00019534_066540 [Acytostelium subglobosum LB1]GAM23479.1 hypothetical protein SAMD00019534_066540 [Acytostelium subglobosum LB1]|eukprot:XP_012753928.1 hypothetical protein SAMD00019534_066540 [Acytostelium subglobosum LB1]
MDRFHRQAVNEGKRYQQEKERVQVQHDQTNLLRQLRGLLTEEEQLENDSSSEGNEQRQHVLAMIEVAKRKLEDAQTKKVLDETINEQIHEREMDEIETNKQKAIKEMATLHSIVSEQPKQPQPSRLRKPMPSTMPKVKSEPIDEPSPYSTPPHPTTSTTTTTASTTSTAVNNNNNNNNNRRVSITSSSLKATKAIPAELTPKVMVSVQHYLDTGYPINNLNYDLGKDLKNVPYEERNKLKRELISEAGTMARLQAMDSLKPIPTSLAPQVLEFVKQYYDSDIASQQLYNELKKVFKGHRERQNWTLFIMKSKA